MTVASRTRDRLLYAGTPVAVTLLLSGLLAGEHAADPTVPKALSSLDQRLRLAATAALGMVGAIVILLALARHAVALRQQTRNENLGIPRTGQCYLSVRIATIRRLRLRLLVGECVTLAAVMLWVQVGWYGAVVGGLLVLILSTTPMLAVMLVLLPRSLSRAGEARDADLAARRVTLAALPPSAVLAPGGDVLLDRCGIGPGSATWSVARRLAVDSASFSSVADLAATAAAITEPFSSRTGP